MANAVAAKKLYTLIKNIKYGDRILKIGDKAELSDKELRELKKIHAINADKG